MDTQIEDKNFYELMVIVNPDIGEDAIKNRLNSIKKHIISKDGKISHEEVWGLRDLAYQIKKSERGYYAIFDFYFNGEDIKGFNNMLGLETQVLRHMILSLPGYYVPRDYVKEAEEKKKEEMREEKKPMEEDKPAEKKTVKKEKKVEEATPIESTKQKEKTLEDVDAKLKDIIDNPDDFKI